jgi:hypothetical protein
MRARRQHQGVLQLGLVLGQGIDFGVRRKAFDQHVDRPLEPGEEGEIMLAQVARFAPVVLVPGEPFFLDRPHQLRAVHQADAGVLGAVYAEHKGCIVHRFLLFFFMRWADPVSTLSLMQGE